MYNILICDDERDIVNALKIYLRDPNYQLFEAYDGAQALQIARENTLHLILMDVMMPNMDGMEAMERIREHSNVPIIMRTSKSEDKDKMLGLTSVADDDIAKPFNPIEVTARVKSQLRRYMQLGSGVEQQGIYRCGALELDDGQKQVRVDGEEVALTPTEYEILKLLMQHPGIVFSPKELYQRIWNDLPYGSENTVAVHIRHLREKVEINPAEPRYLKVVWGQGYKIEKGK